MCTLVCAWKTADKTIPKLYFIFFSIYTHTHTHTHTHTQNPDYMKDGFHITIETIHVPNDVGKQENVST